jgi:hypothetical protein
MLIFMVAQWFDAEVGCVEEPSVKGLSPKATVGIYFANERHPFSLFWNVANLFELTTQEPQVAKVNGLAKRDRGHNQVHKEQSVKIPTALMAAILFQPSTHLHFGSVQQAQVFPPPDHCIHIADLVAQHIIGRHSCP